MSLFIGLVDRGAKEEIGRDGRMPMVSFPKGVVGSMTFGIDVAFYAALIGVPIVLLILTVVALDPGEVALEDILPATIEDSHPVKIQSGQRR